MEGLGTRTSELIVLRTAPAPEPNQPAFNLLDVNDSCSSYPY